MSIGKYKKYLFFLFKTLTKSDFYFQSSHAGSHGKAAVSTSILFRWNGEWGKPLRNPKNFFQKNISFFQKKRLILEYYGIYWNKME